jgi:hypothetical protein
MRIHRVGLAVLGVLLSVACGEEEEPNPVREGDACDGAGEFACREDQSGENDGGLLVCEGGRLAMVMECGDPQGCFTEDSSQQGRCFHGDGTGDVCRYVGGEPSCCTFTEPSLQCQ